MNFGEALIKAKNGCRIQRSTWDPALFVYKTLEEELFNLNEVQQIISHSIVIEFHRRNPEFKYKVDVIYAGYVLAFESKDQFLEHWSPNYEEVFAHDWKVMNAESTIE